MINYMTLADMRGQVGRFVGDTTATRNVKTDEFINLHYADIATRYRWPYLMRAAESLVVTTSGDKFLYLPKDVGQLYFIIRGTPIGEAPSQTIENFFRRQMELVNTIGRFITYADAGEVGRRAEFSDTAEMLTLQNVGGSGSQTVLVHGRVTIAGTETIEITESVTLSGSSAANTTNTFSDLLQVSTDGEQTGYISVTGQASATLYATIEPGERTARYKKLRVGYVSDGETLTMYYKKAVRRLTEDLSVPEIPVSMALVQMAIGSMFMLERKWQGGGMTHMQLGEQILQNVWTEIITQPGRIEQSVPIVSRSRGRDDVIVVSNG